MRITGGGSTYLLGPQSLVGRPETPTSIGVVRVLKLMHRTSQRSRHTTDTKQGEGE